MTHSKRKWGIGPLQDFIEQHGLREKFEALDPPMVATVPFRGSSFKLYIPDAMTDNMQLAPLLGQYHEHFYWINSIQPWIPTVSFAI